MPHRQNSSTNWYPQQTDRIGCVMVSVLSSSVVDSGFDPRSIAICCFSDKHAALRKKSKDWFPRNWDNVSTNCCFSEQAL